MREIRTSGSEGGATESNGSSLPLSCLHQFQCRSNRLAMVRALGERKKRETSGRAVRRGQETCAEQDLRRTERRMTVWEGRPT